MCCSIFLSVSVSPPSDEALRLRTRDPGGIGGVLLRSGSRVALRLGGIARADCARRWRKGRREGLRPVVDWR